MNTISLYSWAKREGLVYSTAYHLFQTDQLAGAFREGSRVKVPENLSAPARDMITCMICGSKFPQITNTHLKLHQMNYDEYVQMYPDSPTVAGDLSKQLSALSRSRPISQANREAVSRANTGRSPWNKGRKGSASSTRTQEP